MTSPYDLLDTAAELVDAGKVGDDFIAAMQERFPDITADGARSVFELEQKMRLAIEQGIAMVQAIGKSKH